eukprot:GEMP01109350.1.p1 GENE.GEMP01109350.1~~GEMP01109350.1.p1  ORF type:complete len:124 (-),score=9.87 GEMP01109350.1:227-598(-)
MNMTKKIEGTKNVETKKIGRKKKTKSISSQRYIQNCSLDIVHTVYSTISRWTKMTFMLNKNRENDHFCTFFCVLFLFFIKNMGRGEAATRREPPRFLFFFAKKTGGKVLRFQVVVIDRFDIRI